MNMKLTALDLAVIVDTLNGSLSFRGGDFFRYTEDARKNTINHITSIMQKVTIELESDNIGESSKPE